MAMTLPPSIRPYWSDLTAEKSAAPPHRDWEWASDPFAAKKEVESRQSKKKEIQENRENGTAGSSRGGSGANTPHNGGSGTGGSGPGGKQWENAPEVRMTPGLRDLVEGTVRKVRLIGVSAHRDGSLNANPLHR